MATRKKKKQRTMQLMTSAALLSTTVAPYVVSADELTTNPTDSTNKSLQNQVETTQTTGDSASISSGNENTIDKGSEITSSAGNTTTESIDNGIVNSTITPEVEAIAPTNLVAPVTVQTVPTFTETHTITLNFKNDDQSAQSVMDGYVNDTAVLGITSDGQKYIQMTVPSNAKGWITGFKSTANGLLTDAVVEEKADETTVFTFPIDSFENSVAWVKIDIDSINYHHDYTVYLDFPNIANEYTEPVVPTPPAFISKYVEKDVNFQFTAGGDFETGSSLDSYLKAFVTQADLVIGEDGKPYADITFGGHSYAGTALKVGSADGPDAEIIASTGSVETKDLVRTVRVALDADYRADIFFGSTRGNYTFKFDLVEEETHFNFTSGTANDGYFSAWVPRADLVETATGEKYAYITLAGHSYAVDTILVDSQAAEIISSTGSVETKDLTRVVRVKLNTSNKAAIILDGGTRGTYNFTFDFTKKIETPFIDTLTANYQNVEFEIAPDMPAMFIVPAAMETVQAKKVADGIAFSIQTTKAESNRGSYKTVSIKQNDTVVTSVSAENNEVAEFTVPSIDGLTIDVVYVTSTTNDTGEVVVKETTYTAVVKGAKLAVIEPTPSTPDTSTVNPGDYTTGSDLDEAVFTEQAKKVAFTFDSLKADIPSAAALSVIVPEATITKKDGSYEVTLQVNPVRTDRLFVTQGGTEIASIDTANGGKTTLTFTVSNLDHLFFFVDGVSGEASGSIETIIGAQVTGYTLLDTTTLPTPDEVIDANAAFTFSTGNATIDGYMKSLINKAQIVKVNGQLYADVTLTGNTYGYTHVKLNNYDGATVAYATNGLTGKDLVRVIRIPLGENKQATVAMFSDPKEDGTRTYDNVFAFDFNPPTKTVVNTAADLKTTDQALAFEYVVPNPTPATSWHAAAFPSNVKAISAKAVNGKVQVMLQVETEGLNAFIVSQNGQQIAKWVNTSSIVLFTVDSLEGITLSAEKTSARGTSTMTVDVKEASLNPTGALPVETIVIEPTTPPVTSDEGTAITYTMVADPNGEMADFITGYLNPYFSNAKLITRDGKKFVQLTLTGKAYGFTALQSIDASGKKHTVTTISSTGEKLEQVRVVELPLIQDSNGVTKVFVDSGELGYGAYTLFFKFNVDSVAAPSKPSNNSNMIITKPSELKLDVNKEASFNFIFGTSNVADIKAILDTLKSMLTAPTIKVNANKKFEVKFKITPKPGVKIIRIMQNGKQLGIWEAPTSVGRIASLLPFFATTSNEVSFEADSLEGITFETVNTNDKVIEVGTKIEVAESLVNEPEVTTPTNPGTVTGGGGGGTTVTPPVASDVESRESISYKMVADPNGPMADFMTSYMNPYFSNAELVTVGGKNYIELTLTGKAYGFQNLSVTGGYKVIRSEGEKMDQVRVIRFPAAKDIKIYVDSGELGYGAYDLLFTFDLSEEQLKNAAAAGTGGITSVQTITPQIVSEGDITFTIPAESSAIVTYAKKIASKIVDGQYEVAVTLATGTDLETFIVKQDGEEIARWDKKAKTASLVAADVTNVLTFTTSSIEDLTFIATTKHRTIEAKVGATPVKKEEAPVTSTDGRQSMTYTMVADPTGPMADFITGYLAPYFSNAVYVKENSKEYVELTLTGKAYGFAKLQYINADGNYVDIDVLSSTGEGLDQVRVVRLPLVQDKDGITKIFVDSGDLGYGAYTLFFKFNVPAKTAKPTVTNPFNDIDGVYSKDDILALYAAGITTGTSETAYSPNASMTRAQFAVMVARTLGVSSTTETKFKDVQGKWYAKEVQALAELGIITGVTDTTFKPGDKITRQQAAVMIHRMLKQQGYTNKTTADALNFKDNAKVADYAKEALAELQTQSIMTGSDGKVNPKANLTRAQMAKILKNAADLVGLLD